MFQDPAVYPSFGDFLSANLGMSEDDVSAAVLYMGAPNQNTTFFLMITPTAEADTDAILEKVESKMESQVQTAEMGYMTGYQEYAIIQAQGRIFAIMHEDADQFAEMKAYLEGLES